MIATGRLRVWSYRSTTLAPLAREWEVGWLSSSLSCSSISANGWNRCMMNSIHNYHHHLSCSLSRCWTITKGRHQARVSCVSTTRANTSTSTTTTTTTTPSSTLNPWEQMSESTRALTRDLLPPRTTTNNPPPEHQVPPPPPPVPAAPSSLSTAAAEGKTTTTTTADHHHNMQHESFWRRRYALSRAITLIESKNRDHQEQASLLLTYLLQAHVTGHRSFRVGIAGAPGAGKSTFIEALGRYILSLPLTSTDLRGGGDGSNNNSSSSNNNSSSDSNSSSIRSIPTYEKQKVAAAAAASAAKDRSSYWVPERLAVICIDPSSPTTGGSILGDKTRMQELSRQARSFVRPSSASGALGGLAPRTDDVVRLVAAASYDLILLETVGLGQSEIEVTQSVDLLLLLVPPAAGDELQGVKKGIVEVSDMLVVTKADGDLLAAAKSTAADYRGAMRFLMRSSSSSSSSNNVNGGDGGPSHTPVLLASSFTGHGLPEVWKQICQFRAARLSSLEWQQRRQEQGRYWMWKNLDLLVHQETQSNPDIQHRAQELMDQLALEKIPPRVAAVELLAQLKQSCN